jgi:esterase
MLLFLPFFFLLTTSPLTTSPLTYLSFHSSSSPSILSDPPLILLHGLLGQSKNFANLGSLLALSNPTRPVYALDLRNHGGNLGGAWGSDMSYEIMSSDVLDWMDFKGVSRATLIGHSMGGKVAMAAARSERGRERLEGLAVIDIAPVEYEPGDGSMWEVIERVIEACEGLDLEQVATKVEANRKLKEGGVEDTNLRGFCCTNLEKVSGGGRSVT